MFGIHKKLKVWEQAGLITADQYAAIAAHETTRHRGRFGRGMTGLALFSIVIGILSIIAANWAFIPGMVKLGVHGAVNIGLCLWLWRAYTANKTMLREGLALVLAGLTLTFIALTGQVLQLGGALGGALLVWLVAITPMMLIFGQTRMTAIPGHLALIISTPIIVLEFIDSFPEFWAGLFGTMLAVFMPLALIADGNLRVLRTWRPVWAESARRFGFILLTLGATGASLLWYETRVTHLVTSASEAGLTFAQGYGFFLMIFLCAFLALGLHRLLCRNGFADPKFYDQTLLYTAISIVMMALPILIPGTGIDMIGAILFVAYWLYIGWYAQQTGAMRLLSLSIFIVALRIYIIYLEAFGGLLQGGVGLIMGGVIMLGMIAGARRLNRTLTRQGGAS